MFDILAKHFYSLSVLKAADEAGSLNRAAAVLNITQPAVSRSIARLEEAVGCRLLERSANGVKLTEFGTLILEHFTVAEAEIVQAAQKLAILSRDRAGAVACAGAPVNMTIVTAAAEQFHRRRPKQAVHLMEGATPAMLGLLLAGEIDVVVGSNIQKVDDERLVIEPLLDEEIGVFARADHPAAAQGQLKMAELLEKAHWVFPDSGTHLYAYIHAELRTRELEAPKNLIESRSTTAIRWLARYSDSLALSTSLVHMPELLSGEVCALKTDWDFPITKHVLYRRPRHAMSRSALEFVDAIKAEVSRQAAKTH